MYHYTDCGLPNVWLKNGYNVSQTAYGEAVAIDGADDLHNMLAIHLTGKTGRLSGKEFRFLRVLLCLSQQGFASMQGVSEQSVSLWERTGKLPKPADATIRMLVLEKLDGDGKMSKIIDRINTVERILNQQIVATERRRKWRTVSQAEKPAAATA